MSTEKIMLAVMSKSVFQRFAQITDEQKAEIVEKVKKKLQDKAGGDVEGETEKDAPSEKQTQQEPSTKDLPSPEELNDILDEAMKGTSDAADEKTPKETLEMVEETVEESVKDTLKEEEGGDLNQMVDDLAGEVESIRSDGQVTPNEVVGLFDNMMQMVTLLINARPPSKPRKKKASVDQEKIVRNLVYGRIAERVASRGNQSQRKDKDLMSDTGGISKGRNREPEQKPPRSDSTVRYRTKRKTELDKDTDNSADKRVD